MFLCYKRNSNLKGDKMRKIKVRMVYDDTFENSFWNFDFEKETKKALGLFEKEFGVKFEVLETLKWNSVGNDDLVLYPERSLQLLKKVPADKFVDRLTEDMITSGGLLLEKGFLQKIEEYYKELLLGKIEICYFMGLVRSVAHDTITYSLYQDLKKKIPKQKNEIIIAFTGKIISDFISNKNGGIAFMKENYVLMWIKINKVAPHRIILHEIGHLFGAIHVEESSVMATNADLVDDFDEKNKNIIRKNLFNKF